jgi:hypothetical protein
MKYLLIHGFGTKVDYDLGFWKYPPTEDFKAWEKDIESGEAAIFSWGIMQQQNWKNIANPLSYLQLYKREKSLAKNKYMLLELDKALKGANPEIIVCHSMGSSLLENYCQSFELDDNLKKIVFSQADAFKIPNIQNQLWKKENLKLDNYYCGWDPALISSSGVNLVRPAGLFGLRVEGEIRHKIKNIFWPLGNIHKNCHIDAINSSKFKSAIELDKT